MVRTFLEPTLANDSIFPIIDSFCSFLVYLLKNPFSKVKLFFMRNSRKKIYLADAALYYSILNLLSAIWKYSFYNVNIYGTTLRLAFALNFEAGTPFSALS